jgi:hypothetical protein
MLDDELAKEALDRTEKIVKSVVILMKILPVPINMVK